MKRFKKVYIEITNRCNLSCSFCPKTQRTLKNSTKKDFLHVIRSVEPYTDYVYFHLMGEPTLHPELGEYLAICKDYGLKVNLTTNGTLLRTVKEILIEAPALRQVNISLHSFEANDQRMSMADYMEGIIDFIEEANMKSNIICSLRLWNMDTATLKAENDLNETLMKCLETHLDLDFSIEEALKDKQGIKLKHNIYLNRAEKFEWPDYEREIVGEEMFCYGLRNQIGILVDGTVVPCCLDGEGYIALGNIFETSVEEILASTRSKGLYEGFTNRRAVEHLCKRCGYATRY